MISDTVQVAVISAGGSAAVAITALLLNGKWFSSLERHMGSLERRIEVIEADLKQFYRTLHDLDTRVTVIEKRPEDGRHE